MSFVAIPASARRQAAFRARRDRLLRWMVNGGTVLAAAIAVLVVAFTTVATVLLGMH